MDVYEDAKQAIESLRRRVEELGETGTLLAIVEVGPGKHRLLQYSSLSGQEGSRAELMLANYVVDNMAAAIEERYDDTREDELTLEKILEGAPNIHGYRDIYVERG